MNEDLRDVLVLALDAELGERVREPATAPEPARTSWRWVAPATAAAAVAAVAAGVVYVANRPDTSTPSGDTKGLGTRVTCSAAFGDADADFAPVRKRALALVHDGGVIVGGGTTNLVVGMDGVDPAQARSVCDSVSFQVRPLITPLDESTITTNPTIVAPLPTSEDEFDRLTSTQQAQIEQAVRSAACSDAAASDSVSTPVCLGTGSDARTALAGPAILSQADVIDASAIAPSEDGGSTEWTVAVTLSDSGAQALTTYTTDHNINGSQLSGGDGADTCGPQATPCADFLAMVVDGQIVSVPVTITAITAGVLQLSGDFDEQSATDLAARLADALPVPLTVTSVDPY